jgi:hypothetical protein
VQFSSRTISARISSIFPRDTAAHKVIIFLSPQISAVYVDIHTHTYTRQSYMRICVYSLLLSAPSVCSGLTHSALLQAIESMSGKYKFYTGRGRGSTRGRQAPTTNITFGNSVLEVQNNKRPTAAKSAGTVGRWGVTSFTSLRSVNTNGNICLPNSHRKY